MVYNEPGQKEFHVILGQRIREARKARGYTARMFAMLIGVSGRKRINEYEIGQVYMNLRVAAAISHVLRIPLSKLIEGLSLTKPTKRISNNVLASVHNTRVVILRGTSANSRTRHRKKLKDLIAFEAEIGISHRKDSYTQRTKERSKIPFRSQRKKQKAATDRKKA